MVLVVRFLSEEKKKKILALAQENAYHQWKKNRSASQTSYQLIEELGKYLQIPPPAHLEVLDISNLFQQDVVAGFLVYLNGQRVSAESRIYYLTPSKSKSDSAWIAEACRLRYQANKELPTLLLVDGGKNQVRATLATCQELGLKMAVAGLTKNRQHQTKKLPPVT